MGKSRNRVNKQKFEDGWGSRKGQEEKEEKARRKHRSNTDADSMLDEDIDPYEEDDQ